MVTVSQQPPLQATTVYASIANGNIIKPNLIRKKFENYGRLFSQETSENINKILRKVVTDDNGTASLANIDGYFVGGKTGTSQNYDDKNNNLNTFIPQFFLRET